ncbi:MAG: hypothetical protein FVQ85_11395 [Planctomycetes bacterium]|nr:hypothetical protein [Planctomycetota bacterium]
MSAGTNRIITPLIVAFILAMTAPTFAGKIIYVDDDGQADFNNIQAAIDDTNDGDAVIVADGTYTGLGNYNIRFKGKAISVMSANGPEHCIINCPGGLPLKQPSCGFIFTEREDANSILDGFTITNGYNGSGSSFGRCGAICCFKSSPTITNCIIRKNSGTSGGAIFCEFYSSPTITNCIIIGNNGGRGGGGICCTAGCSPTIVDTIICGNSAKRGGGIYCDVSSSPKIISCNISANHAYESGGGLHCNTNSSPTITNCIISCNFAQESGGGLYCQQDSSPKITNSSICDNESHQSSGAGILCWDSTPKITNSILWGNMRGDNSSSEILLISSSPIITYSDIKGGWKGEGNIDVDPLFVMNGPDAIKGTVIESASRVKSNLNRAILVDSLASFPEGHFVGELIYVLFEKEDYKDQRYAIITDNTTTTIETLNAGGRSLVGADKGNKYRIVDYYLEPSSPCINAGTAENAPATDIQGRNRNGKPDIGAYETGP